MFDSHLLDLDRIPITYCIGDLFLSLEYETNIPTSIANA